MYLVRVMRGRWPRHSPVRGWRPTLSYVRPRCRLHAVMPSREGTRRALIEGHTA